MVFLTAVLRSQSVFGRLQALAPDLKDKEAFNFCDLTFLCVSKQALSTGQFVQPTCRKISTGQFVQTTCRGKKIKKAFACCLLSLKYFSMFTPFFRWSWSRCQLVTSSQFFKNLMRYL